MDTTNRLKGSPTLAVSRKDVIQFGRDILAQNRKDLDDLRSEIKDLAEKAEKAWKQSAPAAALSGLESRLHDFERKVKEMETAVIARMGALFDKGFNDVVVSKHTDWQVGMEAHYQKSLADMQAEYAKSLADVEARYAKALEEAVDGRRKDTESLMAETKALESLVKQYQEQTGFVFQAYQQGMESIRQLIENLQQPTPVINNQIHLPDQLPPEVILPDGAIKLVMPERVKTFKYLEDGRPSEITEKDKE